MLSSATQQGIISGCQIARQSPKVSHLFFADGNLLFCKASKGECQAIQSILSRYETASGQCVNFENSALLFSPCVDGNSRRDICRITRMRLVSNLGRYLGFLSHFSRNKRSELNLLEERVQKLLAGWKGKLFSVGGKEVLLKTVIQAIPTYTMSCIWLPKGIKDDISKLMSRF